MEGGGALSKPSLRDHNIQAFQLMLIVDIDFARAAKGLSGVERELKQNFHFRFPSKVKSAAFGSSPSTRRVGSIRVNIEITL